MMSWFRRSILRLVDRSPACASAVLGGAARLADAFGAVPEVVEEARSARDRPLERRLQMVQWAVAVNGTGRTPRYFSPAEHLSNPVARDAALAALRQSEGDVVRRDREIFRLDDHQTFDELRSAVERDLSAEFRRWSVRPKKGDGIESGSQAKIIGDITRLLQPFGIQPFLMSGTLLGIVRDGRFLPHDYDIDLGLLPDVDLGVVAEVLSGSSDFEVHRHEFWIVATHTSGVKVDLFQHYPIDDRWWHSTRVHKWWNTPFALSEIVVDGETMWVPDNSDRYLDENYGDWSQPVVFYDISFDTPNRVYRESKEAIEHLHWLCLTGIERGDRWTVESAARELRDAFGVDVTKHLAPSPLLSPGRNEAKDAQVDSRP